jgi:hypothetical protein
MAHTKFHITSPACYYNFVLLIMTPSYCRVMHVSILIQQTCLSQMYAHGNDEQFEHEFMFQRYSKQKFPKCTVEDTEKKCRLDSYAGERQTTAQETAFVYGMPTVGEIMATGICQAETSDGDWGNHGSSHEESRGFAHTSDNETRGESGGTCIPDGNMAAGRDLTMHGIQCESFVCSGERKTDAHKTAFVNDVGTVGELLGNRMCGSEAGDRNITAHETTIGDEISTVTESVATVMGLAEIFDGDRGNLGSSHAEYCGLGDNETRGDSDGTCTPDRSMEVGRDVPTYCIPCESGVCSDERKAAAHETAFVDDVGQVGEVVAPGLYRAVTCDTGNGDHDATYEESHGLAHANENEARGDSYGTCTPDCSMEVDRDVPTHCIPCESGVCSGGRKTYAHETAFVNDVGTVGELLGNRMCVVATVDADERNNGSSHAESRCLGYANENETRDESGGACTPVRSVAVGRDVSTQDVPFGSEAGDRNITAHETTIGDEISAVTESVATVMGLAEIFDGDRGNLGSSHAEYCGLGDNETRGDSDGTCTPDRSMEVDRDVPTYCIPCESGVCSDERKAAAHETAFVDDVGQVGEVVAPGLYRAVTCDTGNGDHDATYEESHGLAHANENEARGDSYGTCTPDCSMEVDRDVPTHCIPCESGVCSGGRKTAAHETAFVNDVGTVGELLGNRMCVVATVDADERNNGSSHAESRCLGYASENETRDESGGACTPVRSVAVGRDVSTQDVPFGSEAGDRNITAHETTIGDEISTVTESVATVMGLAEIFDGDRGNLGSSHAEYCGLGDNETRGDSDGTCTPDRSMEVDRDVPTYCIPCESGVCSDERKTAAHETAFVNDVGTVGELLGNRMCVVATVDADERNNGSSHAESRCLGYASENETRDESGGACTPVRSVAVGRDVSTQDVPFGSEAGDRNITAHETTIGDEISTVTESVATVMGLAEIFDGDRGNLGSSHAEYCGLGDNETRGDSDGTLHTRW